MSSKTRPCRYCNGTGREPVENLVRLWLDVWITRNPGQTQADLARIVGVDQAAVSMWRNGKREPGRPSRIALCEELGITEAQYFEGPQPAWNGRKR